MSDRTISKEKKYILEGALENINIATNGTWSKKGEDNKIFICAVDMWSVDLRSQASLNMWKSKIFNSLASSIINVVTYYFYNFHIFKMFKHIGIIYGIGYRSIMWLYYVGYHWETETLKTSFGKSSYNLETTRGKYILY